MKLFLNIIRYLLSILSKFPFLFWAILLCYCFLIAMLGYTKRNPSFFQYGIMGLSVILTLTVILIYYLLRRQKRRKLKKWITSNFSILKRNKHILRFILISSNWGLLIGSIAFLCVLFKVNWIICLLLFILQITLALGVFIYYISNFNKQLLLKQWTQGIYFTIIPLCLSFFCDIWSRNFVTSILFILPEQVPTIIRGIYWFIFILCCCFISQWIAISIFGSIKNKKIPNSLFNFSYLFILLVTVAVPQILIINGGEIMNKIVLVTYKSDMLGYFRCSDAEIIKNEPNQSARYLKINEQEYRVIYYKNNIINIETIICEGSKYKLTDI